MNWIKTALLCMGIALGGLLIYLGGFDDSPGLQGIGLIMAVASMVGIVRTLRKG